MIERVELGAVVGAHGVVQAEPQLRQLAGPVHHDAGAGAAGVGFAGAVAIDADLEPMRRMRVAAFAAGRAARLG